MLRTGQAHEWSKRNQKQASGITSHHAPETRRGFSERCERQKLRVFCGECQALKAIAECTGIQETEESSTYEAILTCGHSRSVTIAVKYTPTQKEKRGWIETEIVEES